MPSPTSRFAGYPESLDNWSPQRIAAWSLTTFGQFRSDEIVLRAMKEAVELMTAMTSLDIMREKRGNPANIEALEALVAEEAADVWIVVCQVPYSMEVPVLPSETAEKYWKQRSPHVYRAKCRNKVLCLMADFKALFSEVNLDMYEADPGSSLMRYYVAAIWFMLQEIAAEAGHDLQSRVEAKMAVNEKRNWKRTADGSFQHT